MEQVEEANTAMAARLIEGRSGSGMGQSHGSSAVSSDPSGRHKSAAGSMKPNSKASPQAKVKAQAKTAAAKSSVSKANNFASKKQKATPKREPKPKAQAPKASSSRRGK